LRRFAIVVGLVGLAATAGAYAQGAGNLQGRPAPPPAGPPATRSVAPPPARPAPAATPAPASTAAATCQLMTKSGDQYVGTPLPGFDPSVRTVRLPVLQANSNAAMVLCNRTTVVPEVTDYRVLTEMHLPLAISAGGKTVFLGATNGQLQMGVPEGQLTADETKAIQDRIDEMQTAIAGPARPPAAPAARPATR
jgi:hypothetical protein